MPDVTGTLASCSFATMRSRDCGDLGDVVVVVGVFVRRWAAAIPVRDRLGEEALPARADAEGLVAVVEHDGRQQRGEVIVDDARHESLAGAVGDRLAVQVVVVADLVDAREAEHQRTDAVLRGQLDGVASCCTP